MFWSGYNVSILLFNIYKIMYLTYKERYTLRSTLRQTLHFTVHCQINVTHDGPLSDKRYTLRSTVRQTLHITVHCQTNYSRVPHYPYYYSRQPVYHILLVDLDLHERSNNLTSQGHLDLDECIETLVTDWQTTTYTNSYIFSYHDNQIIYFNNYSLFKNYKTIGLILLEIILNFITD